MHGAVLLDEAGAVLRPAILWNDVRAAAECANLEAAFPTLRQVTGNLAMPGFTAPNLLWVRKHEPTVSLGWTMCCCPKPMFAIG
jgi:xylulokinase